MNLEALNEAVRLHGLWLEGHADGRRASLSGCIGLPAGSTVGGETA